MHLSINKKRIYFYLFIFVFLNTVFNFKQTSNVSNIFKLKDISINGLELDEENSLRNDLELFKNQNIFLIKSNQIYSILDNLKQIETFKIKKIFPSKLNIDIKKTSLENAARKLIEDNKIKPKTKLGLNSLLNLLEKWREDLKNKINHNKLLQLILDESGYSEMLKNKKDLENENRLENIKELLNAMKEFDNLESFLEHVALATSLDQDWETEKVNLMTMHASKGLEFDVVFLPGWEEGLFPHQKSIEEKGESGLEEERRLAYVGITRAKKIAKISFSMNRFYQGDWIDSMSSRFIDELPDENLKKNNNFIDENEEDFEFNQDIEFEEPIRSPGWLRYQKKLNDK